MYLIDSPDRPQRLQSLSVNSTRSPELIQVQSFLSICAQNLTELAVLHLRLIPMEIDNDTFDDFASGMIPLTAGTLSPLIRFQQLRDFRLDSITPIDISEAELCSLIQHWPHLQILSLCPQPMVEPFPSQLTLGSLIPFMVYCPHLISLSLWLDATRLPTLSFHNPPPNAPTIRFGTPFKRLDLGSSQINAIDTNLVANYLAHYYPLHGHTASPLPSQTSDLVETYEPRLRIYNRHPHMQLDKEYLRRLHIWQIISQQLPAIIHHRNALLK